MNAVEDKLTYTNRTWRRLRVILEPWAEEYWIKPGEQIDILARSGSPAGHLEIEQTAEGLTIYGWEGSVASIFHAGKSLRRVHSTNAAGLGITLAQTPARAP